MGSRYDRVIRNVGLAYARGSRIKGGATRYMRFEFHDPERMRRLRRYLIVTHLHNLMLYRNMEM